MKKKTQYKDMRSWNMSRIKSKDTKPELILRKALYAKGIRYRKNYRNLPGTPDIVITKYQIVIFVDGLFWHGYNWEDRKKKLSKNRDYWIRKIENNMRRDAENDKALSQLGWITIHFWENEIIDDLDYCISIIENFIDYQQQGNDDLFIFC